MSIDDQLDEIQAYIFSYENCKRLLLYFLIIMLKEFIISFFQLYHLNLNNIHI